MCIVYKCFACRCTTCMPDACEGQKKASDALELGLQTGNPYMCNNECDASTPELAHPPELMFDFEGRHPSTFWQSATWKEYPKPLQVNITLSWSKTIELTDNIVITFESGRPDQMILEKSLDYGRTWQPYQYYATDCLDAFHMDPKSVKDLSQHSVLEIICTEEYSTGYSTNSKIIHFEIKDRFAFFAGPRLRNMASLYGQLDTTKKLRDFFTVTDLRIRLLRPAVGEIFVDELHLARYFYAISDIKVRGRDLCPSVSIPMNIESLQRVSRTQIPAKCNVLTIIRLMDYLGQWFSTCGSQSPQGFTYQIFTLWSITVSKLQF
ncbi:Ntng1 [Phodopus roborovskii]|uniref:Ntng1 protein n=1 Tax=Phodopus roborovskii TaxID=109678 RepID=A0AAU9YXY6_PHORO|nr:Ntng1 [Phodopus roborovskii]